MADVKATASKAAATTGGAKNSNKFMLNFIIVLICVIVGQIIFHLFLGAKGNFIDAEKHTPKNILGTMYSGGFIVPILISTLLTMITFAIERALTIFKARGKMSNDEFVKKVQYHLANKNVDAAIAECDKQSGSVGNVMKTGLKTYKEMITNNELTTEQKLVTIQKEVEEATALELPILEKNLVFLSTIASVATLLGLLGTVLGMIRAFRAMGQAGAPDANALATGISEALVNTALGIGTSMFAIVLYNFYTTIIDQITFGIDESGFTLKTSFEANYK